MWRILRDRRFSGFKFRRQHSIGLYNLDFFCIAAQLNIEVDGIGHGHPEKQKHDAKRDAFLAAQGIRTIRLWNWQLTKELQIVRDKIWNTLNNADGSPHLNPGPSGERKPKSIRRESIQLKEARC